MSEMSFKQAKELVERMEFSEIAIRKSIDNLEKYIEHVKGKQGESSFATLINEFRSMLINVDKLLIDELEPLFFTLW